MKKVLDKKVKEKLTDLMAKEEFPADILALRKKVGIPPRGLAGRGPISAPYFHPPVKPSLDVEFYFNKVTQKKVQDKVGYLIHYYTHKNKDIVSLMLKHEIDIIWYKSFIEGLLLWGFIRPPQTVIVNPVYKNPQDIRGKKIIGIDISIRSPLITLKDIVTDDYVKSTFKAIRDKWRKGERWKGKKNIKLGYEVKKEHGKKKWETIPVERPIPGGCYQDDKTGKVRQSTETIAEDVSRPVTYKDVARKLFGKSNARLINNLRQIKHRSSPKKP